ncbi:MAG: CvpA family protein [Planctomycetota bacterium]
MIFNGIIIVVVLGLGWMWATRGFFSALINLACVLIAGAVAFGLWEPISYAVLGFSPQDGFLSFLMSTAFAIGLVVPFAVTLALLRVGSDAVLRSNVKVASAVDLAGGLACGLASSVVAAGILAIAFSFSGVGNGTLMYRPITYDENNARGSLVRTGSLWIPVDKITAGLYGTLSQSTLATGTPLAEYHPDLDIAGYATRVNFKDGSTRQGVKPEAVSVSRAWVVGNLEQPTPTSQLLTWIDETGRSANQPYADVNGELITTGSLYGVVLRLGPGAKETTGQIILGNGQARLLMTEINGSGSITAFPAAAVSQAEQVFGGSGDRYGRWRFDTRDVFISSIGAQNEVEMGFEFVVPAGYQPEALYFKGVRFDLPGTSNTQTFPSAGLRTAAIESGSLLTGAKIDLAALDLSDVIRVSQGDRGSYIDPNTSVGRFPIDSNAAKGAMEVNDKNQIVSGTGKFSKDQEKARNDPDNLIVKDFFTPQGVQVIQIDVTGGRDPQFDLTTRGFRQSNADDAPRLVDSEGNAYPCVGFVTRDEISEIRYTPGDPITAISALPLPNPTKPQETIKLLFQATVSAPIKYLVVGEDRAILEFNPPLVVTPPSRR